MVHHPREVQCPFPGPAGGPATPHGANTVYADPGPDHWVTASPKSVVIAAVLAVLLGSYGVHNFYLGQMLLGVVKLVLGTGGFLLAFAGGVVAGFSSEFVSETAAIVGVCIYGVGLLAVIGNAVWAFVEFILILMRKGRFGVDEHGLRLS